MTLSVDVIMKRILEKLKLIDSFTMNLPLTKQDFAESLSAISEKGSTGFTLGRFEYLSSDEYEYIGKVNLDGFKVRRRLRFLNYKDDSNIIAKGKIIDNNEYITIETEINSLSSFNIFFFILSVLVFTFVFIGIKSSTDTIAPGSVIGLAVFGGFWLFILYLNMRAGVKRFKYNFERELFYLTRKMSAV